MAWCHISWALAIIKGNKIARDSSTFLTIGDFSVYPIKKYYAFIYDNLYKVVMCILMIYCINTVLSQGLENTVSKILPNHTYNSCWE